MKHSDFYVGLIFNTAVGSWRCTDIGTRTISGIYLDEELDEIWFVGPPYVVQEVLFDELDFRRCFADIKEALNERVQDVDYFISMENMKKIMASLSESKEVKYPREALFRLDRQTKTGALIQAKGARLISGSFNKDIMIDERKWELICFMPYKETFITMTENDFIKLNRYKS